MITELFRYGVRCDTCENETSIRRIFIAIDVKDEAVMVFHCYCLRCDKLVMDVETFTELRAKVLMGSDDPKTIN